MSLKNEVLKFHKIVEGRKNTINAIIMVAKNLAAEYGTRSFPYGRKSDSPHTHVLSELMRFGEFNFKVHTYCELGDDSIEIFRGASSNKKQLCFIKTNEPRIIYFDEDIDWRSELFSVWKNRKQIARARSGTKKIKKKIKLAAAKNVIKSDEQLARELAWLKEEAKQYGLKT